MGLTALNRKLVRDLWGIRGQSLAVALVVAAGVAIYVMYQANFESLREARSAYYAEERFGDVFASLTRAPRSVAGAIAALPGVSAVEARVVGRATLTIDPNERSATAILVSVPAARRPAVNDLHLRRGRWIESDRPAEVMASDGFATARGLEPGDRITALINGHRYGLTIVGTAISPEFVYTIPPGELVPDDRRFGVLWMDERALAAAMDMDGAFNDLALQLSPRMTTAATLLQVDRLLTPYGGLGATPRALQLSHWFVDNELLQLQTFGLLLPSIFLLVGAFTLNVALTRALALQRTQIAALKALGYSNRAIGWHYMKWALLIAGVGLVIGVGAGAWLGRAIGGIYNDVFRFPDLRFRVPLRVVVGAAALTSGAAAAGAWSAVRRAVRVPPAEAMRPEGPARYRQSAFERTFASRMATTNRMVLRHILRRPVRAVTSVVGIGLAVAVLMVGLVFSTVIDRIVTMQFSRIERQDATVTLAEPRTTAVIRALAHLPGVLSVEPERTVASRIRAGHHQRAVAVTGIGRDSRLRRIVDYTGRDIPAPLSGLVLSRALADALDVSPGQRVSLEVLEGDRPRRDVMVTRLVDDVFGVGAYMDMTALHTLMREGDVSTGAQLIVDAAQEAALTDALEARPIVAGRSFKREVVQSFRDTMSANLGTTTLINLIFAATIAIGVVYNAARVSLSERSRELASLRVLGFTRGEISAVLLGELAVLTVAALPIGWVMGYGLAWTMVQSVQSEVYRIPLYVSHRAIAWASLAIVGAATASGLLVRRRLDRLDLVAVLKIEE